MSECCSRLSSHRGDRSDGSGDLGAGDFVERFCETAEEKQIVVAESWWKKQCHCYTGTYLIKYPASVTLNCDPKTKISKITFSFFLFFSKTRYSHIRPLFGGRQFPIFFLAPGRGGQSESTHWWRPHRSSSPLLLPV